MNFRSQSRRARGATTIDITSLVDVVFLLLIFLLVTTTFKRQEHAFPIELPTSSVEQVTVRTDKTTIFVTRDGDLHLLTIPADAREGTEAEAEEVSRADLRDRLGELRARKPDASIAIRGETDASYQKIIDVIALVEDAGFTNIWFPYELQEESEGK